MKPEPKRTYALLLQTESNYGTKFVTARVVYTTLDEPNTLLSPSDHDWHDGAEYANFAVCTPTSGTAGTTRRSGAPGTPTPPRTRCSCATPSAW